ncbi:MAG: hypothetical protein JMDDDDMK_00064 [Acidobacteria bacterium]|nr:hypothetical protein [Acidobacteriota bacterium]
MLVGGETTRITFWVAPDGRLRKVRLLRWGDQTEGGAFGYAPFGGEMKAERSFGGYTIPSQISAGWWFDTDRYFEFFRAEIEEATFNFSPLCKSSRAAT